MRFVAARCITKRWAPPLSLCMCVETNPRVLGGPHGGEIMTRKVHGARAGPWLGLNTVCYALAAAFVPLLEVPRRIAPGVVSSKVMSYSRDAVYLSMVPRAIGSPPLPACGRHRSIDLRRADGGFTRAWMSRVVSPTHRSRLARAAAVAVRRRRRA